MHERGKFLSVCSYTRTDDDELHKSLDTSFCKIKTKKNFVKEYTYTQIYVFLTKKKFNLI